MIHTTTDNASQDAIASNAPLLVKIGGHEIGDPAFLSALAATIAHITRERRQPVVVVHGGGKEISDLQRALGIEPHYIDGVRVTDSASLQVVEMVLAGLVNKRVVGYLVSVGLDATGITGVDRGILRARKMRHDSQDMGFTGDVIDVRADLLNAMLREGTIPVIAPLCLGTENAGQQDIFNVNADHVAGAVGAAVGAGQAAFITNVPGVLVDGVQVAELSAAQANALIADGTINGGMIPKVKTALDVLEKGVAQAVITNLDGLRSGTGTVFK